MKLPRWKLKRQTMTISAKVIRKDGTVEDLGVISKGKGKWTLDTQAK